MHFVDCFLYLVYYKTYFEWSSGMKFLTQADNAHICIVYIVSHMCFKCFADGNELRVDLAFVVT